MHGGFTREGCSSLRILVITMNEKKNIPYPLRLALTPTHLVMRKVHAGDDQIRVRILFSINNASRREAPSSSPSIPPPTRDYVPEQSIRKFVPIQARPSVY